MTHSQPTDPFSVAHLVINVLTLVIIPFFWWILRTVKQAASNDLLHMQHDITEIKQGLIRLEGKVDRHLAGHVHSSA